MRDKKELKQYMKIYYQLCPGLPVENSSLFVVKNPTFSLLVSQRCEISFIPIVW